MSAPSSPPPTVRAARLDDLATLKAFEQGIIRAERPFDETLKPDPISYYDLGELVRSADAEVAVVEIAGEPVGAGYARRKFNLGYRRNAEYAHLGFMYVDPAFRGRGLNTLILDWLFDWCRAQGLREVHLEVYPGNEPAVRAYEKAGFRPHILDMRRMLDD